MAEIHNRMPLIIPRTAYGRWLEGNDAEALITPHDDPDLEAYAVSTFVNNPRHDDARCAERVG